MRKGGPSKHRSKHLKVYCVRDVISAHGENEKAVARASRNVYHWEKCSSYWSHQSTHDCLIIVTVIDEVPKAVVFIASLVHDVARSISKLTRCSSTTAPVWFRAMPFYSPASEPRSQPTYSLSVGRSKFQVSLYFEQAGAQTYLYSFFSFNTSSKLLRISFQKGVSAEI